MSNRAIKALRQAQGVDITNVACLYCMHEEQPGDCRICHGVGKLPGAQNGRIVRVECWNCKGTGKCPQCAGEEKSA